VCRLARENTWGCRRIRGELVKLDTNPRRGCIADILRREAVPTQPPGDLRPLPIPRRAQNAGRPAW
jgi:hypothetical protein